MAGSLMMQAVRDNGATLLPLDSEHNAIFQCLPAEVQQKTPIYTMPATASIAMTDSFWRTFFTQKLGADASS